MIPVYLKRIFADDPIFRDVKIVVSLYGDGFPGELDNRPSARRSPAKESKIKISQFSTPRHTKISAVSLWNMPTAWCAASADVDTEVSEIARASGKPMLEYQSPEAEDCR